VSTDSTRICELLVGLPDVNVLAVSDTPGAPLEVWIETRTERPACPGCGGPAVVKDRPMVRLVDLPAFGRPTELCWRKYRWRCLNSDCETGSWTEHVPSIGWPRLAMTDRAGRWVTRQIGQAGRAMSDVANELGCDWHTINNTIHAFGTPLLDDPERIGEVTALGLDETLFFKQGRWKRQRWATSIVDVARGVLLDMVEGRNATAPCEWLDQRERAWLDAIKYAALDLSGPYRLVFDTMIPDAVQVADPFHVVKLANQALDEVRRRVQNETLGHRGHKDDPLYRCRRLLTKAEERLDEKGHSKLMGLLEAGDPRGEVRTAWHAKELVRQLYIHTDHKVGLEWVTTLAADLLDQDYPPEVNRLGRTLHKWRHQIAAWHHERTTNASTEAANGLIKRIKRVGFGFTNFDNYRLRSVLYAGRPNWDLLDTITPQPR
jgi:transposase